MDQLILLPSILLHENNQLVADDLAALSWPGCNSSFSGRGGRTSSFLGGSRLTFTANGTFYVCVQNDGMSDQPSQGQRGAVAGVGGSRPSSAQLNKERHERIHLLKEKQDHDRLKKLEELKEQAIAAGKLREEQDSRRKKHFEELVKKEDERRKQAEERRRMLDEERKMTLQAKWESKSIKPSPRASTKPSFAFGSCTPRLIDNQDGFLWKSQYNLNVTREPGMRASSATDLHIQQNDGADAMRVFCGRRKTDLTPTIPIKREVYDMSASMMSTRSTSSRGSGRVFSSISMTRLDNRSRSPAGGNLSVPQHQHQPGQIKPSRSKSTTHLSSAGLKLTRTEILRQALAKKDPSGFRSVDQSRPPSSMSSSIMTSSTHSQVQMRPRNITRKSRPASVHVTGISQELQNTNGALRKRFDTSQERRSNSSVTGTPTAPAKKPEPKKLLTGKLSPSPQATASSGETGTVKRPVKKTPSAPKEKASDVSKDEKKISSVASENQPSSATVPSTQQVAEVPNVFITQNTNNTNPFSNNPFESELVNTTNPTNNNVSLEKELNNLNQNQLVTTLAENVEINNSKNESNNGGVRIGGKVIENFESIESAFASGSDYSSKTPEPASAPTANSTEFQKVNNNASSAMNDLLGSELDFFAATTTPSSGASSDTVMVPESLGQNGVAPTDTSASINEDGNSAKKIMTEEQAKAAIAEKRRLAREAAEREAAREVEEQRLEEERQRLEAEEADKFAREARAAEEERLRIAIEEQQKREAEEKLRQEEEDKARVEKEKQDLQAAREAERVRLEMEERLKREEEERLERRKRVEAIMARTRKKEQEQQQQAKSNSVEVKQGTEPVNGHKENNVLIGDNNVQSSNNSLNNNYNNNNDFGNNSTLIEFDGMSQESNNLMGDGTTTGLISNSSTSNPLISNPLQDLLS